MLEKQIKYNNNCNNTPFITIIMVSYNQAKMIETAIKSVLNQNYSNLEFIIIDGNSTDNSLDIIQKYSSQITTIVSEPDRGMYHARNKGILLAKGDYIGFLNTDDIYFQDALNLISNFIIQMSYPDLVFGYTIGLSREGIKNKKIIIGKDINLSKKKYFKKMQTIPDQSAFYKRDALAYIGLYDTSLRFGADTDLKCRFIKREMANFIFPEIIAGWRIYNETLTFRPDLKRARIIEAIKVNHRYNKCYINQYTNKLLFYNYIVPLIKECLNVFKRK